jgi:hypothetical protein
MSMIKAIAIVALSAAFLAIGSNADENWRIEAGQVEFSGGEEVWVRGSFLVHAPEGTPADAAPREGGACLLADLVAFGVGLESCKSFADCNSPRAIDKANNPAMEDYVGYCVARDGSTQPPRCWTRPGPAESHCKRSVDGLRLTAGKHQLEPVPADPLKTGARRLKWAVIACLADADHPRACGEEESAMRQMSLTPMSFGRD